MKYHIKTDQGIENLTDAERVMTDEDRDHMVTNITNHVKAGVSAETRPKVIEYRANVSAGLGARVAKEINGS